LSEEIAVYQAEELLREPTPLLRKILSVDKTRLRLIAQHIAKQSGRAAYLGAIEEDANGKRGILCFAAAPGSNIDAGKRLKEVCQQLGGRGGGKPHLAEGSCPVDKLHEAIQ
jgi:alanyl-tRNA synthetase